ncbi:MAG: hypothetical protein ACTSRZ_04135 [Promethearchaeota archaeon]
MDSAETILKTIQKQCFKGKERKVYILIREIRKDLLDIKVKEEDKSKNIQIRVHTSDEKAPPWFTHAYIIPLRNLGLNAPLKKNEMLDILNGIPNSVENETATLLKKIIKDYGSIKDDGSRNKLKFKTSRFKKQKDYFRVKMKTL